MQKHQRGPLSDPSRVHRGVSYAEYQGPAAGSPGPFPRSSGPYFGIWFCLFQPLVCEEKMRRGGGSREEGGGKKGAQEDGGTGRGCMKDRKLRSSTCH